MADDYTYGTATEVAAETPVDTENASGGAEYTAAATTAESAYVAEEAPVETTASVSVEEPIVAETPLVAETEPVVEHAIYEPDWTEDAPAAEPSGMGEDFGAAPDPHIEDYEYQAQYPDRNRWEPQTEDYESPEDGTDSNSDGMDTSESASGVEETLVSEPVDVSNLPNGPFYVDISDIENGGSVDSDPLGEASVIDPSAAPGLGDVMTSIQDVVTQLGSAPGFENAHASLQDVLTQLNDIPGLGGSPSSPVAEDIGDPGTGVVDVPDLEHGDAPEGVVDVLGADAAEDLAGSLGSVLPEEVVDPLSSVLPGGHDLGDLGIDPTQIPGLGDVMTNLQDVMTQLGEVPGLGDMMTNLQDVMTQLGQVPGLGDIPTGLGGAPDLGDMPWLNDIPVPDQLPLDELPLDELPLDELPLDELPLDGLPLDGLPLDQLPLDGLPLDQLPLDELPLDELPLDQLPVDEIPGGEYLDYAQNAEQYGTEIIDNLEQTFGPEDLLDPNGGVIEAAQESSLGYDMLNDNIGGALDTADEVLGDGAGQAIYDVVETMGDLNGITSAVASASPVGWGLSAYNFIDDGGLEDVYHAGSDAVDWAEGAATDAADWVDGAATDAAEWAEEAVDDVGDAVSDAGDAIGSVASDIGDALSFWD
ncbi:hypothetical protein AB0H49_31835 [Nocardia sp. NPDC050713]|uniref:hypothetical protein n=1 Tax=Nocardia sp. NPDC050713 TaxID=3154511 RepID=UPI0033CF55AF